MNLKNANQNIPECLRGVFTTMHHTKPSLPLPSPLVFHWAHTPKGIALIEFHPKRSYTTPDHFEKCLEYLL